MDIYADKTKENKRQSAANEVSLIQSGEESAYEFTDNRSKVIAQGKLQEMANNSPQVKHASQLQTMADNYSAHEQQPIQTKENKTGLPDNLKLGMENLSGYSLDDVKVHYKSDKPEHLQALAYTQDADIHVGPGQEQNLPHEAWHVVQQKQGRVKPTMQSEGVSINDDEGLEQEADMMSAKAMQMRRAEDSASKFPAHQHQQLGEQIQRVASDPYAPTPHDVLHLHQEVGNQAPGQLQTQDRSVVLPGRSDSATEIHIEPVQPSRPTLQRKYANLDYGGLKEILDEALIQQISQYNNSSLLSGLENQEQRKKQADKDVRRLVYIMDLLSDKFDAHPNNKQLNELYSIVYQHQTQAKEIRDAKIEEAVETYRATFKNFPKIAKPEHKKNVFSGVEYIVATISGKTCRLYAFQNYLNTEYSMQLWGDPPEKGGAIPLMRISQAEEKENVDYENWAVKDAHHRFVWRAHHGVAVDVEFRKFNLPENQTHAWSELTYEHDPKQSYQFKADDKWATDAFHAAFSPLFPYRGWFEEAPEEFINYTLKHIHRLGEDLFIEEPNIGRLKNYISGKLQNANVTPYRDAIRNLVAKAEDKESAQAKAAILLESLPSAQMPNVAFASAPSTGYISAQFNVVVLDPDKNPTADALLDTLAYETGNIERRDEYLAGERTTVDIEFEATESYVELLMESTNSGGINQLVAALDIPKKYLILADAQRSLKAKKLIPEMPDMSIFGDQSKRTALSSWKTQDWTKGQRKQYFATTQHAEGMKETAAEYSVDDPVPKGIVEEIKNVKAQKSSSFTPLIYAMMRAYPKANDAHYAKLSPRHFGEFLWTGKVNKWEAKRSDEGTVAHRGIVEMVVREIVSKYPGATNAHIKDMTHSDFGEFILSGKIQTWDVAPH
jgi:hypothetical protein